MSNVFDNLYKRQEVHTSEASTYPSWKLIHDKQCMYPHGFIEGNMEIPCFLRDLFAQYREENYYRFTLLEHTTAITLGETKARIYVAYPTQIVHNIYKLYIVLYNDGVFPAKQGVQEYDVPDFNFGEQIDRIYNDVFWVIPYVIGKEGDVPLWSRPYFDRLLEEIVLLYKMANYTDPQSFYLIGEGVGADAVVKFAPALLHHFAGVALINCRHFSGAELRPFMNVPLFYAPTEKLTMNLDKLDE